MLEHKIRLNLYVLLAFFLILTACDMFGGDNNDDDNSPPNASVTANTTDPVVGDTVTLDASESSDPDGDKLTFSWTLETPDGSNTALSAQTAVDPQFIPDKSGNYTARLEVDDGSLTGSDDLSLGVEDEPDSVTVKANLSTTDNGNLTNCVVEFTPESGDTVTKNTCADPSGEFAQNSGTVEVTATADDYQQMEKTTSTKRDRTLEFALEPETPDQSTVTFAATEADTLVSVQVFVADTLAADGEKPTVSFPYGETIDARIEAQFMKTKTITFTAEQAEQTESTVLKRKSAEIFVSPQDNDGNVLSEATTVIYEPDGVDSTKITGEGAAMLVQKAGNRAVAVTNITERADKPDRLIRFEPFSTTVSASEDAELVPNMARLPACNDGINNETGESDDGRVDVWSDENGNGFADKGEGDPGCVSSDDDNEGDITYTLSLGSGGGDIAEDEFVSSAEDERELYWAQNNFSESIKDAVLINSRVEVKLEDDQDGEEFAMRLECGANTNLTEITEDTNEADGWTNVRLRGITAQWFEDSTDCLEYRLHASKVRDEEPGDGNDDVFFLVNGDGTIRFLQIQWTIEEEDDHRKASPAGLTKHSTDSCRDTQAGRICVSSGDPKAW
jgi:hypothetical protein